MLHVSHRLKYVRILPVKRQERRSGYSTSESGAIVGEHLQEMTSNNEDEDAILQENPNIGAD